MSEPPHGPYSIRWVPSVDDLPAELWGRCFPPPLEGRWWYLALEQAGLEDQFAFAYAAIEQHGEPVGIAPTFVMDVPMDLVAPPAIARLLRIGGRALPRLRYQRTLFVGSPCSEEGTVGLLPGQDLGDLAPIIQQELWRRAKLLRAPMIIWKDFAAPAAPALEHLTSLGLFKLTSYPGTSVGITGSEGREGSEGSGFEGYLRTLSAERRYKLRNKLKRGRDKGALEARVIQHPDDAVLREIFQLFWQTYEHGKTKFERLTPRFFELISRSPVSHFVLLRRQSGQLAAFMLIFRMGRHAINKFIGLDYALGSDWFLYFRLWEQAVDFCARSGVTELQSGQTGYTPKFDLGHSLIPLTNYCHHANPVLHRLFAAVARRISWSTLDEDLKTYLNAHPELKP